MNPAYRRAQVELAQNEQKSRVRSRLDSNAQVSKLNKRVTIAKSGVWQQIREDIRMFLDNSENVLHYSKNPQDMIEARGESNMALQILLHYDGAESERMELQRNEDEQDAVLAGGMVPQGADQIGGQDGR